MKPVLTDWSYYSETGLPVWLVVVGFALALWFTQAWLRRECRSRAHPATRLLPWTLTVVLLLTTLVLWRPVITRTSTWNNEADILAVTDPTLSMQLPVAPKDVTDSLNLAAVWDPAAVTGRNLSARVLREKLVAARELTRPLAGGLERLRGEIAQGVPAGSEATRQLEQYRQLQQTMRAEIPTAIAIVHGSETLGSLEKALADLSDPPAPGTIISAELLNSLLTPLTAFHRAIEAGLPLLEQLQETADRSFIAANQAKLDPVLTQVAKRTRADLAVKAAEGLPPGTIQFTPTGERDQTDLFDQIEQALASRNGHVVSHCVLFSDGAQNGAATSPLPARLKKDGIKLITVGTGLTVQSVKDVTILDWQLPRVLLAGKPARLRADIKAAAGVAFTVTVSAGDQTLATTEAVGGPAGLTSVILNFTAPPPGRHDLRLSVAGSAHRAIEIQADSTLQEPRLLLVGSVPDWDTAWFGLASERGHCNLTQVFTADETLKRGGLSRSIPASLLQWSRYRAVLLEGAAFAGFSEQDGNDLYRFVSEKGGTLFLFANDSAGFGGRLATRFGWKQNAQRVTAPLRLAAAAAHLPCLRLGVDGPQSARRFATLAAPTAFQVPAQDIVLVESERGEPVCSLGFYGRGKVIQWGIQNLHRMREFDNAVVVDRLLDGMVGELAAPLFPENTEAGLALYPPLPQAGRSCWAILPGPAALNIAGREIAAAPTHHDNALFVWVPQGTAAEISAGAQKVKVTVSDNPGLETLAADFNEKFLRDLATAAGGESVSALQARPVLTAITPQTFVTRTADRWHPGSSPYLLVGLILVAALHWVLRKLAGLAI